MQLFVLRWIEADDASPVAEGDPKHAIRVNGHAVRGASVAVCGSIDDDMWILNLSGREVVIVGADFLRRRIDIVHRRCIGAPADAVGIGYA